MVSRKFHYVLAEVVNVCKSTPVADELVRSAIEHWGPRFTGNGVDPSDFHRITSTIGQWSQWCARWSEAASEHEALGRTAWAEGRERSAGIHLAQASTYYHFAKFLFVHDLDQMRQAHQRAVTCLTDALPYLDPPGRRVEVAYRGATMIGVLRVPRGPGPWPAVLMVSGLDSAKEELRTTEDLFLARGLATFTVDGPGQGEVEYHLPIEAEWERPGAAFVDALSAQPEIDAERIGVWGVSLGGYYAPRLASGDGRIRACIALAGPYDFSEGWDRLPALTRLAFQVRGRCADESTARELAAELTLAGRTSSIAIPLQIVFGRQDRLIAWPQAQRLADEVSGPVELLLFDDGNHVCTNISYRHRYRSADWMASQLAASPPSPT